MYGGARCPSRQIHQDPRNGNNSTFAVAAWSALKMVVILSAGRNTRMRWPGLFYPPFHPPLSLG